LKYEGIGKQIVRAPRYRGDKRVCLLPYSNPSR